MAVIVSAISAATGIKTGVARKASRARATPWLAFIVSAISDRIRSGGEQIFIGYCVAGCARAFLDEDLPVRGNARATAR